MLQKASRRALRSRRRVEGETTGRAGRGQGDAPGCPATVAATRRRRDVILIRRLRAITGPGPTAGRCSPRSRCHPRTRGTDSRAHADALLPPAFRGANAPSRVGRIRRRRSCYAGPASQASTSSQSLDAGGWHPVSPLNIRDRRGPRRLYRAFGHSGAVWTTGRAALLTGAYGTPCRIECVRGRALRCFRAAPAHARTSGPAMRMRPARVSAGRGC